MFIKEHGAMERKWASESERSGIKFCPCYFWDLLTIIILELSSSQSGNRKKSINASSLLSSQQTPSIFLPISHEPGVWTNLFLNHPPLALPLTLPSRLDKGHYPIPFSSRIVSKLSLHTFFNYTFFVLKPHEGKLGDRKEEVVMVK